MGTIAVAAGLTAYQTGYFDKLFAKEHNNDVNTHPTPVTHEEPQQSKPVNEDLRDGILVEKVPVQNVPVQNVEESEISSPPADHGEKNVEIDPYYDRREEENQPEIKQLPSVADSDHNISTSDNASVDSIAPIQEDSGTKSQDVTPTTEQHDGVQITPIPTEVVPVIEENVNKSEPPQQPDATDVSQVCSLSFLLVTWRI